jgi:mannose-6-phosphate isomerase-like protein (cupin superfamily)
LDPAVSYSVLTADQHEWVERPAVDEGVPRHLSDITEAAGLVESRARLWRIPAGGRGRRHIEGAQEEVFVVLEGTLTLLLGEPPERFDLGPRGVAVVQPGSAIQLRNESDSEVTFFAYGAPPVSGQVELLDDLEL